MTDRTRTRGKTPWTKATGDEESRSRGGGREIAMCACCCGEEYKSKEEQERVA